MTDVRNLLRQSLHRQKKDDAANAELTKVIEQMATLEEFLRLEEEIKDVRKRQQIVSYDCRYKMQV